ncbi:hypothetical protein PCANC_25945 [Puccinia coronata f. sp. avenae]|uniref:Uncharacterized protein n=1 Tax=Puccinia coronata f. sp. avenae TaxID=200324 RepID=A0A2N5U6P3_9BASI|nr:hypothetical protein PCANC_25945 [Puccinia coronata f. sp. avenae]
MFSSLCGKYANSARLSDPKVLPLGKSSDSAGFPGKVTSCPESSGATGSPDRAFSFPRLELSLSEEKKLKDWLSITYEPYQIPFWLAGVSGCSEPSFLRRLLKDNPTLPVLLKQYDIDQREPRAHLTPKMRELLDRALEEISLPAGDDQTSAILAFYLEALAKITPVAPLDSVEPLQHRIWAHIEGNFKNIAGIVHERNKPMFESLAAVCRLPVDDH